jgi:hypothetical protein
MQSKLTRRLSASFVAVAVKEKSQHDYSLRHDPREVFAAFTLLDSKVLRSVGLVVSKPGYLSSEFFKGAEVDTGNRSSYSCCSASFTMSPFRCSTPLRLPRPLATQLRRNDYHPAYANRQVSQKMQQVSYEALQTKYNEKTSVLSKTLIFLLVPILAFLFFALFFRKGRYCVERVVVATHFWSFNLLVLGVILPVVTLLLRWLCKALNLSVAFLMDDNIVSSLLQVGTAGYLLPHAPPLLCRRQLVLCSDGLTDCLVLLSYCLGISLPAF